MIRPRTVQLAAAGTGMGCEMDQTDQEELVAHWISKLWECVSTVSVCEARRGKGQQRWAAYVVGRGEMSVGSGHEQESSTLVGPEVTAR